MGLLSGKTGLRRYIGPKRVILLIVFGCLTGLAWYYWKAGLLTPEVLFAYIDANPILAPILFVLLYSLCILFVVPSLPFNLAAGFLWGPIFGSGIALTASVFGSICAFLFARTAFGQPLAEHFDNRLVTWMQSELDEKGWKVLAFMCVNPAIPLGPQNFIFGLTAMPFRTFAIASAISLYPPVLAVCYLGYASGQLALVGNYKQAFEMVLIASVAITVLVVIKIASKWLFAKQNKD